jgi:hypothetical protein
LDAFNACLDSPESLSGCQAGSTAAVNSTAIAAAPDDVCTEE